MVIENHPLIEGQPFPTTFWLTCPLLVQGVSRLEAEGALTELTERLGRDPDLKRRLAGAVGSYRDRRDRLAVIEDSGGPPGGGPDRVKCLHAHVAHELVDAPNPIGALAMAQVGWPDCVSPCVTKP